MSGNGDVAFRFVFKSDGTSGLSGLAIDDVEVIQYEGEPKTQIVDQSGAFNKNGVSYAFYHSTALKKRSGELKRVEYPIHPANSSGYSILGS